MCNENLQCKKQSLNIYEEEAKAVGLIFLGKGSTGKYKLYKYEECGHIKEIPPSNIRRSIKKNTKKFKCSQCIEEKLKREADLVGLELTDQKSTAGKRVYKFKACNHVEELSIMNIRKSSKKEGSYTCKKCLEEQYKQEAEDAGLILLDKDSPEKKRAYIFKDCNHEQEIAIYNVRIKNFSCNQCFQEKIRKEAEEANLILTDIKCKADRRVYQFKECGHRQEIEIHQVRQGKVRCRKCRELNYIREANEAGLTIVGECDDKNYKLYQFKDCGHKQKIRTVCVREKSFKCEKCYNEKINREAEAAGLILIGRGRNSDNWIYEFKDCKHKQEFTLSSVRLGSIKCSRCEEERYSREAENAGLKIIGKASRGNYRLYEFKDCGHKQEIRLSSVRALSFSCLKCTENKYINEAEEVGLKLLGPGSKSVEHRLYEFKDCGHTQEITLGNVRRRMFSCIKCYEEKIHREAENAQLILVNNIEGSERKLYKFKQCGHTQEILPSSIRNKRFRCNQCNGIKLVNGILVRSYAEKIIGDWLIENNIEFEYEKRLSKDYLHKTDYYLVQDDIYIEVVGYENNYRNYMDKLEHKINLHYTDKKLILITYGDITKGEWEQLLKDKINNFKINSNVENY